MCVITYSTRICKLQEVYTDKTTEFAARQEQLFFHEKETKDFAASKTEVYYTSGYYYFEGSVAEWKLLDEKNSSATQQMRLGRQKDDWACWLNYRRRPWEAGNTFKFNHLKDMFITWNMEVLSLSTEFSVDTGLLYAQESQASRPQCILFSDPVPHRSREASQSILSVPYRPAKQLTDTHPWSQPFKA